MSLTRVTTLERMRQSLVTGEYVRAGCPMALWASSLDFGCIRILSCQGRYAERC